MTRKEFEINGHKYEVTAHVGDAGSRYTLYMMSLLPEALVPLITKALEGRKIDLERELKDIDFTASAAALSAKLEDLSERPALVRGMFKHTIREGKPLSNTTNYEAAFSGGNWGEWLQALVKIININGWLPLPSTSSASDLKNKIAAALGDGEQAAPTPVSESILARSNG